MTQNNPLWMSLPSGLSALPKTNRVLTLCKRSPPAETRRYAILGNRPPLLPNFGVIPFP
jgi:hypothetical protein